MDSLFQQAANISKAQGYDILADHVGELKEVIRELIAVGELEELEFTEPTTTAAFKQLIKKAKILSL